jgi:Tfp pilus assembly protein PilV
MKYQYNKRPSGMSLAELLVAMSVLIISLLGAVKFRYYSNLDAHKSEVQNKAVRLASTIMGRWKIMGDYSSYDLAVDMADVLTISELESGPTITGGFSTIGYYHIDFENVNFYVTLGHIASTSTKPDTLTITVGWMIDNEQWDISEGYRTIEITSYAEY